MYSFSYLEPVCCSMSSSNSCFLTCIQVSQEAGQVVWYSHLLKNFPQFVVIHTVKGFGIMNKPEIDIFWNTLAFLMIQQMLAIWSLVPLPSSYLGGRMQLGVVKEILALPVFLLISMKIIYSYIFSWKMYIFKNPNHSNSSFFFLFMAYRAISEAP